MVRFPSMHTLWMARAKGVSQEPKSQLGVRGTATYGKFGGSKAETNAPA